jgi:hypothetical protein
MNYWKNTIGCLNELQEIIIHPNTKIDIPIDNCVDEFIITSEDYKQDIFKFQQKPCYDGSRIFPFDNTINISSENKTITINKKIVF